LLERAEYLADLDLALDVVPSDVRRWVDQACAIRAGVTSRVSTTTETQPMPNAFSWVFHWMPHGVHAAGVAINHLVEVVLPFAYFAPQPIAAIAGIVTILFQGVLIVSGNLSWLNWLTIVLCIPLISDRWLSWIPVRIPADLSSVPAYHTTMYVVAAAVVLLSISPVVNLLSSRQLMNASFEPLHRQHGGAFGSITRERYEIVVEGPMRRALRTRRGEYD
jgi:hypothetical protein